MAKGGLEMTARAALALAKSRRLTVCADDYEWQEATEALAAEVRRLRAEKGGPLGNGGRAWKAKA